MAFLPKKRAKIGPGFSPNGPAQTQPARPTRGPDPRSPNPDPSPSATRPGPKRGPADIHCPPDTWRDEVGPPLQADASRWRHLPSCLGRASRARVSHAPTEKEECSSRDPLRLVLVRISAKSAKKEANPWLTRGTRILCFRNYIFTPLTLLNCILALFPTL